MVVFQQKEGYYYVKFPGSCLNCDCTSHASQGTFDKPLVVDHYNNCMNSVDLADQYTVYYSFICKSKKWWWKVCFWFIEVAIVNFYILYKSSKPSWSHIRYRRSLVESLAGLYSQGNPSRAVLGQPCRWSLTEISFSGDPERLNRRPHFLAQHNEIHQCVVCSTPQKNVGPLSFVRPAHRNQQCARVLVMRGTTPKWATNNKPSIMNTTKSTQYYSATFFFYHIIILLLLSPYWLKQIL